MDETAEKLPDDFFQDRIYAKRLDQIVNLPVEALVEPPQKRLSRAISEDFLGVLKTNMVRSLDWIDTGDNQF